MKNKTIIHLISKPAVGKYTIAKALQKETDAFLVDNHLVNDLFFCVTDTSKNLPPQVFGYLGKAYDLLFDYIKTINPQKPFIFTNVLNNSDEDLAFARKTAAMAKEIGYTYLPIKLTLDEAEILKRIANDDRKTKKKMTDPELYKKIFSSMPLIEGLEGMKEINTNGKSVKDTVEVIKQYLL